VTWKEPGMAKGKRLKSGEASLIEIADWREADNLIGEIGDLRTTIEILEVKATDKVDQIKTDLAEKVKPIRETIAHSVRSLEAFATARRAEFGKAKSRQLANGKIGWRESTAIRVAKNTLGLIKEAFSRAKRESLINVKETPDKNAMAALTDEELRLVGARRERKEAFFAEPDLVEAAEY